MRIANYFEHYMRLTFTDYISLCGRGLRSGKDFAAVCRNALWERNVTEVWTEFYTIKKLKRKRKGRRERRNLRQT
ncbi:hypothetical protein Y032_0024g911 [Ancylostoma ceylanicum]|uniref:Uncharacterized protein n=1 Tax=Ancylostoma ceylanicum TaxID=53326 RepID=A0A016UX21_9BILA|nr:hypothetical protein Y032_0024g911 [Ancylostoma ceylanicum]